MKTLADLTAPAPVIRKILEAELQQQCVAWARKRGYWARKFSSISQRSVPDYLFAMDMLVRRSKHGTDWDQIKFACEFKRPGCKRNAEGLMSTDAQIDEQNLMRAAGWFVFECDDLEMFKQTVLAYEKERTA